MADHPIPHIPQNTGISNSSTVHGCLLFVPYEYAGKTKLCLTHVPGKTRIKFHHWISISPFTFIAWNRNWIHKTMSVPFKDSRETFCFASLVRLNPCLCFQNNTPKSCCPTQGSLWLVRGARPPPPNKTPKTNRNTKQHTGAGRVYLGAVTRTALCCQPWTDTIDHRSWDWRTRAEFSKWTWFEQVPRHGRIHNSKIMWFECKSIIVARHKISHLSWSSWTARLFPNRGDSVPTPTALGWEWSFVSLQLSNPTDFNHTRDKQEKQSSKQLQCEVPPIDRIY